MNIPGKTIVDKMEAQLILLRKAVMNGDEREIREACVSIEAYSQLLKGATIEDTIKSREVNEVKSISTPQTTPLTSAQPVIEEGEKRNLLDF